MTQKTREKPISASPEQEQKAVAVRTGGAAAQSNLRNIRLIIGREYKARITQRSFIVTTVIFLLLVIIGSLVPTVIQLFTSHANTNTQTSVTVVNDAGSIAGLANDALSREISTLLNGTNGANASSKSAFAVTLSSSAALADLKNQVKNGKLAVLLVLERTQDQSLRFTYYTSSDPASDSNLSKVQTLAQQLNALDAAHRLGLTQAQTASLFAAPALSVVSTQQQSQDTRPESEIITGYILAYAGNILIYIAVLLYGMSVAMGIAEEKGSRVMEILVNAATPLQLMIGKIVGIGAAGLTQMAAFVIVGIGSFLLQIPLQAAIFGSNSGGFTLNVTGASVPFLLLFLLYFILGFLLYSTILAGIGALVRRQEEVQGAVQLPMMLMVGGYVVSFVGVYFPNSTWMRVLSFIPFFTPTTMLVRIGTGQVAWWEIAITVPLMIITFFICAWLAARIYRFGILMYGQKPSLRQMAKLVRRQ